MSRTVTVSAEREWVRKHQTRDVTPLHIAISAFTGLALLASPSRDSHVSRLPELASAMVIAKSSNRNQVHYAVAVDDSCNPAGPAPVRPYWRMLERGPSTTEPLQASEQRVLGVDHQEVSGNTVQFSLRGMPGRQFTIHSLRAGEGRCASWVGTTIAGSRARIGSIFVQQGLFGSVDYVLLKGTADDGSAVSERLSP
jgi:hypothetical protein